MDEVRQPPLPPPPGRPRLPPVADALRLHNLTLRAAHASPRTIAWYSSVLGTLPEGAAAPTADEIRHWLAAANTSATARARLRALRAVYAPHRAVYPAPWQVRLPPERPRPPRALTAAEIAAALQAAPSPATAAAIAVALATGARVGELARLTPADVDPAPPGAPEGVAIILTLRGKDGPRRIPASPAVAEALARLAPAPGKPYWPGGARALTSRIRYALARAGITPPRAGPHVLRATFAGAWLARGGDLWHLSRMLGHASIAQTQAYLALSDLELWNAYAITAPATIPAPATTPATRRHAAL